MPGYDRRFSIALLALLGACKSGAPSSDAEDASKLKSYVFKHQGTVRDVSIFEPGGASVRTRRPLVVVLHGGLGDDDDTVSLRFQSLDKLASADDFVVAYPQGIGGHWNDGRRVGRYVAQRERIDDVGFLATLIDDLVERGRVDSRAVFMVGVSDGAMMAHRFACEKTGRLRGFSAVIGALPVNIARTRARCGSEPLSVLMINGTKDPIVPWEGGMVEFEGQQLGKVLSAERTFEFWRRHDACTGVDDSLIPDFAPKDGTRIERRRATGCASNTKVELFAVRGAGHTWPSGWQYLPPHMIGATSRDIDAAVAAWRFFQSSL